MTNTGEASATPKRPPANLPPPLLVIIACCFLRAVISFWFVTKMFGYISRGAVGTYPYLFILLAEAVVWILLGIGLRRLRPHARVAAMIFCGAILLWSSYLFLS